MTTATDVPAAETYERLSLLIHANSKIGKSTLSATGPRPILVLDAEGSWRFIPLRKVYWDPMQGGPPTWDGTWDVCVVLIHEWQAVEMVYKWLVQTQTAFKTVVIDSITELQRRCKANLKGTEAMKIQDWGVLLSVMDSVIRGFRDLTLLSWSSVRCVIFVAETRMGNNGKYVPYMQGQIAISLPYWVDICGFLYPDMLPDNNGQPQQEIRRLLISPHPQYEAGERVQGRLGGSIPIIRPADGTVGNDIEQWIAHIYQQRSAQAQ